MLEKLVIEVKEEDILDKEESKTKRLELIVPERGHKACCEH